jgi:hypothetical protein
MRPHVKVGNRYGMEEGEIEVDAVVPGRKRPGARPPARRRAAR